MDEKDIYGEHLALIGSLVGPRGVRFIKSVSVRRTGEKAVRLVTLYPVKEQR